MIRLANEVTCSGAMIVTGATVGIDAFVLFHMTNELGDAVAIGLLGSWRQAQIAEEDFDGRSDRDDIPVGDGLWFDHRKSRWFVIELIFEGHVCTPQPGRLR